MRISGVTTFILILFLGAPAIAEPIQQVSELVKKYTLSEDTDKPAVLENFDKLARKNPENVNVIRSYTSLLASRGDYQKSLTYLEPVNRSNANPSLLLQECMLKERLGKKEDACYQRVISESESNHIENMDYLMALFFTNDDKFPAVKQRLLTKNPALSNDFTLFSQDKRSVLMAIYP
ncbi:tetratricopeptide repeat protein [Kosakonia cowanii]